MGWGEKKEVHTVAALEPVRVSVKLGRDTRLVYIVAFADIGGGGRIEYPDGV